MKPWKKYIAECIGTATLVLLGCGVAVMVGAVAGDVTTSARVAAIASAFGLSIVAAAYAIGGISGCHINPAVSLGVWMSGKMSANDFMMYVLFQVIGAFIGAFILRAIIVSSGLDTAAVGLGQNGFGAGYGIALNASGAILTEIALTFIFVFCILGVTSDDSKGGVAGLVIGGALMVVHLLGINLTGTSVNPARSLAPAILVGGTALSQVWVFILAPLVGAALAALTHRALAPIKR